MKPTVIAIVFLSFLSSAVWASPTPTVAVYKSPSCGCCEKWVTHMKHHGFNVVTHHTEKIAQHKARLGVPYAMGSCHTAEVSGYLIEGHVPAADVKRLLAEAPRARGLLSPGMPASSPGMDMPSKQPYQILLLGNDGKTKVFASH